MPVSGGGDNDSRPVSIESRPTATLSSRTESRPTCPSPETSSETIADVPSDVEPPSKSASNDHSSDDDAKPSIEIKTPEFFPQKINFDNRAFDLPKYQKQNSWLYFNPSKDGYICKFCELFPCSASETMKWVNQGIQLGTHPSRKLKKHAESERHKLSESKNVSVLCSSINKKEHVPIYQKI